MDCISWTLLPLASSLQVGGIAKQSEGKEGGGSKVGVLVSFLGHQLLLHSRTLLSLLHLDEGVVVAALSPQ
jgi:hypothetical protein